MNERGVFISFEGIDGAGKSTHIEALAAELRAADRDVVLTREPGGSPLAERIRTLVLHDAMDALTEALLMFAARRDHLCTVIKPALRRGAVVLCDRFTDASFAYQGGARGVEWSKLLVLEGWVQGATKKESEAGADALVKPDLTFWFDLDPALAASRIPAQRDRFEREPVAFFEAVRRGYARRQREEPERFCSVDAAAPRTAVAHAVRLAMRERGWL